MRVLIKIELFRLCQLDGTEANPVCEKAGQVPTQLQKSRYHSLTFICRRYRSSVLGVIPTLHKLDGQRLHGEVKFLCPVLLIVERVLSLVYTYLGRRILQGL